MAPSTKQVQCPGHRQGGSFLLEGMVAILIFAFGILGLVGILAGSIRASNDARYRTEAINLANAIVGDMWTTQAADLDTQFGSGRREIGRLEGPGREPASLRDRVQCATGRSDAAGPFYQ